MSVVLSMVNSAAVSPTERQRALDRIHSDPGIPSDTTTSSFWLQNPHPDFDQASSKPLPTDADVVIIGSGITGASIARTLLQNRAKSTSTSSHPAVVMLEARDICSGATGRNGGHILETADEYAEIVDAFGEESARKLLRFRLAHLREMLSVAEELGLTEVTQARKVQFLSAYFGNEPWKAAVERLRRFKEGMPEESAEWASYEGSSIPEEFNLSRATGVVTGPAGALWPYKFVTGVLSRLLSDYSEKFHVADHTVVKAIHSSNDSIKPYEIETSRGTITAKHVIHCTNAHVGHLVPGLRGRIFPVRGQMSAQTPGDKFPLQAAKHSWLFNYDRGFDYLTQLPTGEMMFGGGFANGEGSGVGDLGISKDDEMSVYLDIHLSGALSAVFGHKSWGSVHGDPIQAMWTGNMAFSTDGFPWVGRLPSSATGRTEPVGGNMGSEWVCAAFGGEGMVQAWLCGKALSTMILKHDDELVSSADPDLNWFPEQLLVSEERVAVAEMPKTVSETGRQSHL